MPMTLLAAVLLPWLGAAVVFGQRNDARDRCAWLAGAVVALAGLTGWLGVTRQALAKTIIPHWAKGIEALIGAGPYVGGAEPAVADIKIFMMAKALNSGSFDDIPTTVLAPYLRIAAVAKGVETNPAVRAWYAPKAG